MRQVSFFVNIARMRWVLRQSYEQLVQLVSDLDSFKTWNKKNKIEVIVANCMKF